MNGVLTKGLGGPLLATDGFGAVTVDIEFTEGPGALILDHVDRALALFVTQFRRKRDLSLDTPTIATVAPSSVVVDTTVLAGEEITDHVTAGLGLFITQFRRKYV